jgi:integrase
MRAGEALSLTWGQVDLMDGKLRVGRAKTANGTGREIPINDDLAAILAAHSIVNAENLNNATIRLDRRWLL